MVFGDRPSRFVPRGRDGAIHPIPSTWTLVAFVLVDYAFRVGRDRDLPSMGDVVVDGKKWHRLTPEQRLGLTGGDVVELEHLKHAPYTVSGSPYQIDGWLWVVPINGLGGPYLLSRVERIRK